MVPLTAQLRQGYTAVAGHVNDKLEGIWKQTIVSKPALAWSDHVNTRTSVMATSLQFWVSKPGSTKYESGMSSVQLLLSLQTMVWVERARIITMAERG